MLDDSMGRQLRRPSVSRQPLRRGATQVKSCKIENPIKDGPTYNAKAGVQTASKCRLLDLYVDTGHVALKGIQDSRGQVGSI